MKKQAPTDPKPFPNPEEWEAAQDMRRPKPEPKKKCS